MTLNSHYFTINLKTCSLSCTMWCTLFLEQDHKTIANNKHQHTEQPDMIHRNCQTRCTVVNFLLITPHSLWKSSGFFFVFFNTLFSHTLFVYLFFSTLFPPKTCHKSCRQTTFKKKLCSILKTEWSDIFLMCLEIYLQSVCRNTPQINALQWIQLGMSVSALNSSVTHKHMHTNTVKRSQLFRYLDVTNSHWSVGSMETRAR